MKKTSIVLSGLVLILTVSCSGPPKTSQTPPTIHDAKIESVRKISVDEFYEAVGTVRSRNTSQISSRVMGNIVAIHVHEGDTVHAGQTLIEIENRDAKISVDKAEAALRESTQGLDESERGIRAAESGQTAAQAADALASSTLKRYQVLFDRHSVSPQEFDEVRTRSEIARAEEQRAERMLQMARSKKTQAMARIDQAKAAVADAWLNVGYARISSPINGIVLSKQAGIGNLATPGMPLLTIEDNSVFQLEVSVEESKVGTIHLHDQVRTVIDSLGRDERVGTVEEIIPATEPNSRSFIVKISLPELHGQQIQSGLYGKARFAGGQQQVLSVPQKAVTERGQLTSVFVVDTSGIARMRLIRTGKTFGENIEVLSGLSDGEQIVSDGIASISDGTRVRDAPPVRNLPIASR